MVQRFCCLDFQRKDFRIMLNKNLILSLLICYHINVYVCACIHVFVCENMEQYVMYVFAGLSFTKVVQTLSYIIRLLCYFQRIESHISLYLSLFGREETMQQKVIITTITN